MTGACAQTRYVFQNSVRFGFSVPGTGQSMEDAIAANFLGCVPVAAFRYMLAPRMIYTVHAIG